MQGDTTYSSIATFKCINNECMLDDLNARVILHRSEKRTRYLGTSGITTCMQNSVAVMATLASEGDLSALCFIKYGATSD